MKREKFRFVKWFPKNWKKHFAKPKFVFDRTGSDGWWIEFEAVNRLDENAMELGMAHRPFDKTRSGFELTTATPSFRRIQSKIIKTAKLTEIFLCWVSVGTLYFFCSILTLSSQWHSHIALSQKLCSIPVGNFSVSLRLLVALLAHTLQVAHIVSHNRLSSSLFRQSVDIFVCFRQCLKSSNSTLPGPLMEKFMKSWMNYTSICIFRWRMSFGLNNLFANWSFVIFFFHLHLVAMCTAWLSSLFVDNLLILFCCPNQRAKSQSHTVPSCTVSKRNFSKLFLPLRWRATR